MSPDKVRMIEWAGYLIGILAREILEVFFIGDGALSVIATQALD